MLKSAERLFLAAYVLLTVIFACGLGLLLLKNGKAGFYLMQGPADASPVIWKFTVFCLAWLLAGIFLWLAQYPEFFRKHAVFLLALLIVSFLYLNMIRQPHQVMVGDFRAYFLAAEDLAQHRPVQQEPGRLYLYPPLLATVLRPLVPLGLQHAARVFQILNLCALILLGVLLYVALQQYGFLRELAALVTLLFLCANVPVQDTLVYLQINLHVMNLVLLCLLCFPKHPLWSALFLSVAIHLKVYPLLLVLPFLYKKQWKWCGWLLLSQAMIVGFTSALNSPSNYIEFFRIIDSIKETGIRNASIDSFVFNTLRILQIESWPGERLTITFLRIGLAGLLVILLLPLFRSPSSANSGGSLQFIHNAIVLLPIPMLALSPTIWVHHFVLLSLTVPVLFSRLRSIRDAWVFGAAYTFIFLIPVNEIYPVAYLRLMALVLLAWLARSSGEPAGPVPGWFRDLQARLSFAG